MASVGIKRLTVDNTTIQTKTGTAEYTPSSAEKTPVLDDGSGSVMFTTQERKPGMMKVQVSTLKSADAQKLRDLEDGEVVMELLDGTTVVGSNMTQTANNSVTAADGVLELEFILGKKIKLQRPIQNAAETGEINEVEIKDEKDISASDFYDVSFSPDGSSNLGAMADTIANLTGLTSGQVAALHVKDYIKLSAEVGKYID